MTWVYVDIVCLGGLSPDGEPETKTARCLQRDCLRPERTDGGFIRAWNEDKRGWAIIDCMMNIPILYHASELTDDDRFTNIARRMRTRRWRWL